MDQKQFDAMLSDADTRLRRLKVLYEQWFMGIERVEPSQSRKEFEDLLAAMRKEMPNNTAQRFRLQQLVQRHVALSTHWRRVGRQIEEGTYQRDLQRAKKRKQTGAHAREADEPELDVSYDVDVDEDLAAALAEADRLAQEPPAPAVAARAPQPTAAGTAKLPLGAAGSLRPSLQPDTGAPARPSITPFAVPGADAARAKPSSNPKAPLPPPLLNQPLATATSGVGAAGRPTGAGPAPVAGAQAVRTVGVSGARTTGVGPAPASPQPTAAGAAADRGSGALPPPVPGAAARQTGAMPAIPKGAGMRTMVGMPAPGAAPADRANAAMPPQAPGNAADRVIAATPPAPGARQTSVRPAAARQAGVVTAANPSSINERAPTGAQPLAATSRHPGALPNVNTSGAPPANQTAPIAAGAPGPAAAAAAKQLSSRQHNTFVGMPAPAVGQATQGGAAPGPGATPAGASRRPAMPAANAAAPGAAAAARQTGATPARPAGSAPAQASGDAAAGPARQPGFAAATRQTIGGGTAAAPRAPAPVPSRAPQAQAAKPATAANSGAKSPADFSSNDIDRVYNQYVAARGRNAERTDNVKRETIEKTIRTMLPQLEQKHAGKKIDFEVVVKDGRVALKPVAK